MALASAGAAALGTIGLAAGLFGGQLFKSIVKGVAGGALTGATLGVVLTQRAERMMHAIEPPGSTFVDFVDHFGTEPPLQLPPGAIHPRLASEMEHAQAQALKSHNETS